MIGSRYEPNINHGGALHITTDGNNIHEDCEFADIGYIHKKRLLNSIQL